MGYELVSVQRDRERQVIAALIRWSVGNRFLVLIATAFLVAAGLWSVANTPRRRAARPVGHPGHRAHDLPGQAAAGGRGPGHLSADDDDAERAGREDRPRLLVLRRLVRLRALRRQDRSVLGAVARGRVPQPGAEQAARRRHRGARAGRHRRRLGLRVRAGRPHRQARPRPAARAERLVPEVRAEDRARRRRGGQHRRHGAAVPGRARPGPHARARHHAGAW